MFLIINLINYLIQENQAFNETASTAKVFIKKIKI